MVIRKYSDRVSPTLLALSRYKLARLYHYETMNSDLDQEFANEAHHTSSKHGLTKLAILSDILLALIMNSNETALCTLFLDVRIEDYRNRQCKGGTSIFTLYKLNFLLTNDPPTALVLLQEMCADQHLDNRLRTLCVLLQSNLLLLRGSLAYAKQLIDTAQSLLERNNTFPHQFEAMNLLLSLLYFVRLGDNTHAQLYTQKINLFIRSQQEKLWPGWESNAIPLLIKISTGNSPSSLACLVGWLSHKEFMLNFNLIAAVSLLRQPPSKRSKAIYALKKTESISSSMIKSMTDKRKSHVLDRKQASRTLCRLHYIRYTTHIYRTWAGFLDGDFDAIRYMNEFMQSVNKRKLVASELLYCPLILPRLFYIFAVYYHYRGDLQMAKYYYMKVRNAVSEPVSSREQVERSRLQLELGVGSEIICGNEGFNELYVYSTMNLVLLNEYECKRLSRSSKLLANPQLRLNNVLYRNLMTLFAQNSSLNKFNAGFERHDHLAALSYYAILSIFSNPSGNGSQGTNPALNLMRGKMLSLSEEFCFPFFQALINFRLYMERTDSPDFESLFAYCKAIVSRPATTDLEKSLFLLILKHLVSDLTKSNEPHKASIAQLHSEQYQQEINHKIQLLRAGANVETCDTAKTESK